MELLYVLLILLVVTRMCSEFAIRAKQPALVGELVGGVLIGAAVAAFASDSAPLARLDSDETFQAVLDLAVFFLMLHAGIEMRPRDLAKASKWAIPIAIGGMLVPLALGYGLGWWWLPESQWKSSQSLFLGVALAITAVPVAVKVLIDLGRLQSRIGQVVVAAAVTDDVLSLILLAVLTSVLTTDNGITIGLLAQIALSVAAFFLAAGLIARYVLPGAGRLLKRLTLEHAEFSILIVFGLALAVLAEALGMHFLIGAFTAGVLFTRQVVGKETYELLTQQTRALTVGFLAPVFFASIGIHLDIGALLAAPVFLILLLLAATAGKVIGSGVMARLSGFSSRDSLAIGSAMNARGAVEIIIADIALRAGLFERPVPTPPAIDYLFSAVVIMAIVTTLGSPFALRLLLPKKDE
ncbi:MAG: cation:proton antiporter [Gammaproteobacteria bacterium]|jgi:Kef-type K+ transport system membrane component KefB